MRRGSIIGPVILIALGLLFLMRNFLPDFRVWSVVSNYWPYLLIGWGALRVLEVLNWHRNGQLAPRSGMSGGEWALVIFICLIGSGMYFTVNSNPFRSGRFDLARWDLIGESFDYTISGTQTSVGKTPRILVENARGNARITGVDTEEIRVTGTKTIRAVGKDDADKENTATNFELVRNGDQIVIRTNLERASNSRQAKADLEILVPKGSIVEARGKYGDFDVENVNGNVEVTSDNAGVRMDNIGGDIRVDTRRGDIVRVVNAKGNVEVKGRGEDVQIENVAGQTSVNGQYSGDLHFRNLAKPFKFESQATTLRFEKVEGEVDMALGRLEARKVTGPIRVSGKSKDIEISDFTDRLEIDIERGDVRLRPIRLPLAKMDVKTGAGEVDLILPDQAKLDLRAEVKRGSVDNDFGGPFKVSKDGRSETLTGKIAGGPEVSLQLDRGKIRVRKATQDDEPSGLSSAEPPAIPKAPALPRVPAAPKEPLEVTRQ